MLLNLENMDTKRLTAQRWAPSLISSEKEL